MEKKVTYYIKCVEEYQDSTKCIGTVEIQLTRNIEWNRFELEEAILQVKNLDGINFVRK